MDLLFYIIAGAGVGLAVGLTGVGGGSLMTPILIFSGIPEKIAIGTDLLYAAITKSGGAVSHARQKTIRWPLVLLLCSGSIPASLLTSYYLNLYGGDDYGDLLTQALGFMLIATATVLLFKKQIIRKLHPTDPEPTPSQTIGKPKAIITLLCGLIMGVLVTLSSVGAGAFCAVLLLVLFPRMPALQVIGTDIAHAVPLTMIGGLGHFFLLGNVDLNLLTGLLIGSLPAVHIGAKFAARIPNSVLQPILASLLLLIGSKFLFWN